MSVRSRAVRVQRRMPLRCRDASLSGRAAAESIVKNMGVPRSEYEAGRTKIFFRTPEVVFMIEEARVRRLTRVRALRCVLSRAHHGCVGTSRVCCCCNVSCARGVPANG